MTKVVLAEACYGEYSDRQDWVVAAFASQEAARRIIDEKLNEINDRIRKEDYLDFRELRDEFERAAFRVLCTSSVGDLVVWKWNEEDFKSLTVTTKEKEEFNVDCTYISPYDHVEISLNEVEIYE